MNRRNTLKTIGIGALFGATAGTASATPGNGGGGGSDSNNPGRVGRYDGQKTFLPPDLAGFDQVLVYLAEPLVDGEWDSGEQAERFQREIMGRDEAATETDRRTAEAFYEERFGLTFPGEADLFEPEMSEDGTARLSPFYQDPDVGYNAYAVSGRAMPNNRDDGATNRDEMLAGKVRDGGWIVSITEDTTLRGTYGEDYGDGDGFDIDAGGTLAYGDYNIKLGDNEEPIVIHYESEHPILPLDMPVAFNCDLFHEEWGEGQVRGTTNVPGGGIRNVLTFPPSL
jgi:hypothetical protein